MPQVTRDRLATSHSLSYRRWGRKVKGTGGISRRAFSWYSNLTLSQGIEKVKENVEMNKYVQNLIAFCETTKRGIHGARKKNSDSEEML